MSARPDDWYVAPTEVAEAIDAIAHGARVLAGGTDLVASINLRDEVPDRVVWLGRLGLDGIINDELVRIGACTTLASVAEDPGVRSSAAALAAAARRVAGPSVRNLATVGGSLCAAWPRSDVGCAALGLDGIVLASSPTGERRIPMSSFYAGPGRTNLAPDDIVLGLEIRPAARSGFSKIGRRSSMSLAVVNAAARLELDDGAISEAVVAVGAGHVPVRAPSVEGALTGRSPESEVLRAAARNVLDDVEPADDEHATSWYRGRVAPIVVLRALMSAIGAAGR